MSKLRVRERRQRQRSGEMSTGFCFGSPWAMSSSSSSSSSKSGPFCFPSSPSPSPFSLSSSISPSPSPSPSPQFFSCISYSRSISTNPGTGLPLGTPSSSSSSCIFGASPNPNPNPNPSFGAASGLASTPFSLNTSFSSSSSTSTTLFGSPSVPSQAPAPAFGTSSFPSSSSFASAATLSLSASSSSSLFGASFRTSSFPSSTFASAATPSLSTSSSSSLFGASFVTSSFPLATFASAATPSLSTTAAAMPALTASTTLMSTTTASTTSAFSGFALPSPSAPAAAAITTSSLAPASTSSLFQSTSASLLIEPVPERPTPLLTVTAHAEAAPMAGKVRVKLEEGEIASDAQAVRVEPLAKGSISETTSKAATVVSPTGGDDEWSLSDERDRPEAEPEVPATHAPSLPQVKVETSHSTDTEGASRGESRMESARSLAKGLTESTSIQCPNDLAGDAPIQHVVRTRIEEAIAQRLNRIVVPVIPASQVFEDNRGMGKRLVQRLLKSAFANNGIPSFDDFADRVSGFLTGLASLDIDPAPHAQVLTDLCKKLIGLEVISAARDRITHPTEASKLEGLRASLNEAKAKLTTVDRAAIDLKAEHEQIKTGIRVTREMIQKMEETLAEVRSQLAEARSKLATQEEDEKIIETDIASLEQEAIIKSGRVNILHSQYTQTQDLVDRLVQDRAFLDCAYSDEMRQVSDMASQLL